MQPRHKHTIREKIRKKICVNR